MKTLLTIISKLEFRGVKPIKVTYTPNPTIWITSNLYIDVNDDELVIFSFNNNKLSIYRSSHHIGDLMETLRSAVNE
jgi:DNA polymerase III sliding clamp (beta) subunit (PCNA family)